jgi:hypothetical protein
VADYRLKVIPKPDNPNTTVLRVRFRGPAVVGDGPDNYLCGACGKILCKNIAHGQIASVVFNCDDCGSYNAIIAE